MKAVQIAYLLNILILIPVAVPTLLGLYDTAQGRFDESEGFRILVGAFWTAILVCSVAGLFRPEPFVAVLIIQLLYKSTWLAAYALPRLISGRAEEIPLGIAVSFVGIVIVWPFLIPWKELLVQ